MKRKTRSVIGRIVCYDIALLAKEKYYSEWTPYYYDEDGVLHCQAEKPFSMYNWIPLVDKNEGTIGMNRECNAPTQSELQRWLRDRFKYNVEIKTPDVNEDTWYYEIHKIGDYYNFSEKTNHLYVNYEDALESALMEMLNLL